MSVSRSAKKAFGSPVRGSTNGSMLLRQAERAAIFGGKITAVKEGTVSGEEEVQVRRIRK